MAGIGFGLTLGSPAEPGELAAAIDPRAHYLRVGPLAFPAPLDALGESLGDGLEAVGAALVLGERRPRPFKLSLAVHGDPSDADERAAGLILRRQLRQILENAAWRAQGLYFYWPADPELSGWLMVGGGELEETDPGVTFGEFKLELTDCYLRGRPATHRSGRRLNLADRRTGLVPRDTRGTLYSTDYAELALPATPVVIPGDVANVTRTGYQSPDTITDGPSSAGRLLWRAVSATDGDVLAYVPDPAVLTGADAPLRLEEPGAVRVWDTTAAQPGTAGYAPTTYTDANPALLGWERIYGTPASYSAPLAIDNGAVRLLWIPGTLAEGGGLALEAYNPATGLYDRRGVFATNAAAGTAAEVSVVELTAERTVLEWRLGSLALRAILQRGWWGPRLEVYADDPGGPAGTLFWNPAGAGTVTVTETATDGVYSISRGAGPALQWATATAADAVAPNAGGAVAGISGTTIGSGTVTVGQAAVAEGPAFAELAALGLVDARSEPVLLRRTG